MDLNIRGVKAVLLRLKRVRHPDVVSLEHFLKDAKHQGIDVCLAGLRLDLIAAMRRLKFFDWLPQERTFPHGSEE